MTDSYDRDSWERRWTQVLSERPDMVATRPPNAHLLTEVGGLRPGRALDAGCGHGAETLWLAGHGWDVTAVDFSAAALGHARSRAAALDLGERIEWIEADLGVWAPAPGRFDLVVSLFVHVAGSVEEMVRGLAAGVAPGGTLLLVGAPTRAPGQTQVSVDDAVVALDPGGQEIGREIGWEITVAEDRPRDEGGVDAVVCARRQSSGSSRRSGSRSR